MVVFLHQQLHAFIHRRRAGEVHRHLAAGSQTRMGCPDEVHVAGPSGLGHAAHVILRNPPHAALLFTDLCRILLGPIAQVIRVHLGRIDEDIHLETLEELEQAAVCIHRIGVAIESLDCATPLAVRVVFISHLVQRSPCGLLQNLLQGGEGIVFRTLAIAQHHDVAVGNLHHMGIEAVGRLGEHLLGDTLVRGIGICHVARTGHAYIQVGQPGRSRLAQLAGVTGRLQHLLDTVLGHVTDTGTAHHVDGRCQLHRAASFGRSLGNGINGVGLGMSHSHTNQTHNQ